MRLEWLLTVRYLQSSKGRFLCSPTVMLSILGVCVSVATLIAVMAVMDGFSSKLLRNVLGINGHVIAYCSKAGCDDLTQDIAETVGVVSAVRVVEGQAMIKSRHGAAGAVVRGMEAADIHNKLYEYALMGDPTTFAAGAVLGSSLAESLRVNCGDEIVMISFVDHGDEYGPAPTFKHLVVTGIFNVGMHEYDSTLAYIPVKDMQELAPRQNNEYVEAYLDNVANSTAVAADLAERTGMRVFDWKVQQGQYFLALQLERDSMFFILSLIVVMAALSIGSGVAILVRDKRKAIAIMRAMGMSRMAVVRVFSMCGLTIGAVGVALGCILGVSIAMNMDLVSDLVGMFNADTFIESIAYCLDDISLKMVLESAVKVSVLAFLVSCAVTLPPAFSAASKNPVDILKYE